MTTAEIPVRRTERPRPRVADDKLGFGNVFTDHMFVMDYETGRGWHDPRIVPYGPMAIEPSASAIQYGQTLFEGMKAFPSPDGRTRLFRPETHAQRLNNSARRLCMPEVEPAVLLAGVRALLRADADWMPRSPGTAMYIRPTVFATEGYLGVRPSNRYALVVMLSPVGSYFGATVKPLRIWVEQEYVRAVRGGIGAAKAGGNYAASLLAAQEAKRKGYDQVLWLDGVHRRYLEEIGTMNVFVQTDTEVVTPPLEGALLPGVTRDSILTLLRDWNLPVVERPISLDEVIADHAHGRLRAMFGTGTAAVVSSLGELAWDGKTLQLDGTGDNGLAARLRNALSAIQRGQAEDPHGWMVSAE